MKFFKIGFLIVFIIGVVWWVFLPQQTIVVSPRAGLPFISTQFNRLDIEYQKSVPFFKEDYKIYLKQPLNKKYYSLKILEHNLNVNQGHIVAGLRGMPVGRYDLLLKYGDNKKTKNIGAVFIKAKITDDLKIIQIADLPKINEIKILKKIIGEINVINPDVVLITGDLTYRKKSKSMKKLKKLLNRLNPPYIIAPGNHEYEDWHQYLKHYRKTRHINTFGNFVVTTLNSGHYRDQMTYSQLQWVKDELKNHKNKTIFWQIHHSLFGIWSLKNLQQELVSLIEQYQSPFVVSGHNHADDVFDKAGKKRSKEWDFDGTKYIITTTAGRDLRPKIGSCSPHYGYRLLRIKNRKLINYTYDYDGDGTREPSCSVEFNNIKVSYPDLNQIKIINNSNESFKKAMVSISYDGDRDKKTDIGEIIYKYTTEKSTYFFIEFDLPKKSTVFINLTDL